MTNKEIREKVTQDKPIKQDRFANGIRTLINESPLINAIQDATRADERERMLEEINEILAFFNNYSDADKKLIKAIHNKLNTREKQ